MKIQQIIGNKIHVLERGSTRLKVSGKDEIDIFIPVLKNEIPKFCTELEKIYGPARSKYENRARFGSKNGSTRIEVFIVDKDSEDFKNINKFEDYLLKDGKALKKFEEFKIKLNGRSTKNYYAEKISYLNKILKINF